MAYFPARCFYRRASKIARVLVSAATASVAAASAPMTLRFRAQWLPYPISHSLFFSSAFTTAAKINYLPLKDGAVAGGWVQKKPGVTPRRRHLPCCPAYCGNGKNLQGVPPQFPVILIMGQDIALFLPFSIQRNLYNAKDTLHYHASSCPQTSLLKNKLDTLPSIIIVS